MSDTDLYYDIQKQLNAGFSHSEITSHFLAKGCTLTQIEALFQEKEEADMTEFRKQRPLLTHKLTPLLLLVLNYFLFFHVIPESTANSFAMILAFAGGILNVVFLVWTIASLVPFLLEKAPVPTAIVSILTLFVFGYFFIHRGTAFSDKELRENGNVTVAKVTDRTQIWARGGEHISTITVLFKLADKSYAESTIDVSEQEYENFSEGSELPILYSVKHPDVAIIAYPKTLENYEK